VCCCFACAATLVGVLAGVCCAVKLVLESFLCSPAATIVAFSAVDIACGVVYTAALVSSHVLGMLLQGLLLSCVQQLSAAAACAIVA